MRVRNFGNIITSNEFLCESNTDVNNVHTTKFRDIPKLVYDDDSYIYDFERLYMLWTDKNNLFLTDFYNFNLITNVKDFGTTSYTYFPEGDEYYIGISFYIGYIPVGRFFVFNGSDIERKPVRLCLRWTYLPYAKYGQSSNELVFFDLIDSMVIGENEPKINYTLYGNNTIHLNNTSPQYTDIGNTELSVYTFLWYDTLLENISSQENYNFYANCLEIINTQYLFSYPYKPTILKEWDIKTHADFLRYENYFFKLFFIANIYKRKFLTIPALDLSFTLAPVFSLVPGGAFAYLGALGENSIGLVPYYMKDKTTSNSNFYTTPCSNYTDVSITDVISNFTFIAPSKNMFTFHYEPKLGFYIVTFINDEVKTTQSGDFNKRNTWNISDFPIEHIQQQFVDSYVMMDFPVYTKLIPNIENYIEIDNRWISPSSKNDLHVNIYALAFEYKWHNSEMGCEIKKDELHTGKVTLNLKHCKQNNDYTPKYKCYTPNSVYISELTKYKYSQQTGSEISIIDKETAFVIPIGVSVDKPIITTILHNIVQKLNNRIYKGEFEFDIYCSVLLNDGELEITESTPTIVTDVEIAPGGLYRKLYWYVGSFFQPYSMVNGRFITKYTPGSNLSRYTTYSILSETDTNYKIKILKLVYKCEFEVEPTNVGKNNIKYVVGTSGIPIVELVDGKYFTIRQISFTALPKKHILLKEITKFGKLSYTKITTDEDNIYTYFGDSLFIIDKHTNNISELHLNKCLKDEKIRLLAPFTPDVVKCISECLHTSSS